jgi:hypothetical protein
MKTTQEIIQEAKEKLAVKTYTETKAWMVEQDRRLASTGFKGEG